MFRNSTRLSLPALSILISTGTLLLSCAQLSLGISSKSHFESYIEEFDNFRFTEAYEEVDDLWSPYMATPEIQNLSTPWKNRFVVRTYFFQKAAEQIAEFSKRFPNWALIQNPRSNPKESQKLIEKLLKTPALDIFPTQKGYKKFDEIYVENYLYNRFISRLKTQVSKIK